MFHRLYVPSFMFHRLGRIRLYLIAIVFDGSFSYICEPFQFILTDIWIYEAQALADATVNCGFHFHSSF